MLDHFGFQKGSKLVSGDKKGAMGFQNVPDGSMRIQWSVHVRPMVAKVGQAGFKRGSKEPNPGGGPGWTKERHKGAQRDPKRRKRNQKEVKEEAREMEKLKKYEIVNC